MQRSERERGGLVRSLAEQGAFRRTSGPRVRAAFLAVEREHFVPRGIGWTAIYDPHTPIVTKTDSKGQAISSSSAPSIMAPMLELLDVGDGQRILEVGAGTGYNAALLSELVGRSGQVDAVDIDRDIVASARANIRSWRNGAPSNIRVRLGDGRLGWPAGAPYDRIILTVGASASVLPALTDQLADGGVLVLPMRAGPFFPMVIPSLVRDGSRLLADDCVIGGFMELRDQGADAPKPTAEVMVVARTASGEVQFAVQGPAVETLGVGGRTALIQTMALTPKRQRVRLAAGGFWVVAVMLAFAHPRQAVGIGGFAGVVAEGGQSLAAITGDQAGLHIRRWGGGEAADILRGVISTWRQLGEPDMTRLRLEIVDRGSRPRRRPWRTLKAGGTSVCLSLAPRSEPLGPGRSR